jgi:hypothetical protein
VIHKTTSRSKSARRRNPSLLSSRVSVADALLAWPALTWRFGRAAAVEALTRAGFLPGDEAAEEAVLAPGSNLLVAVLERCGTPACLDAAAALGTRLPGRALVRAAPHVLPALQAALFDASVGKVAVWTAAQVARTALPYVPAGEGRPRRAIEAVEAWVRGKTTVAQIRAAVEASNDVSYDLAVDDYDAAAYAADAATSAASAAGAGSVHDVGFFAVDAVVYAAAAAAWGSAQADPERDPHLAELADLVRSIAACPELTP